MILPAQNIQRRKFPAAVFCADLTGHILIRGIQIKDKPHLRRKIGAEFFWFRLLDIHNFLQLGQDPVVKFRHMVPSHMKRKSFITRKAGQRFDLFLEILFHPAELSVADIISRIGSHIQLRQAAVHPDSVKYPAASHLFLGNMHENTGIAFRTGQNLLPFLPSVFIFKFDGFLRHLIIEFIQPPSEQVQRPSYRGFPAAVIIVPAGLLKALQKFLFLPHDPVDEADPALSGFRKILKIMIDLGI